jgi:hypothetical protein
MKNNIEGMPGRRRRPLSFRELRQASKLRPPVQDWEDDELTRDALEGMSLLADPERAELRVHQLRERAKLRIGATRRRYRAVPEQTWGWVLASAAAVLLLALFLIFPRQPQTQLADAAPPPVPSPALPESPPAAEEKSPAPGVAPEAPRSSAPSPAPLSPSAAPPVAAAPPPAAERPSPQSQVLPSEPKTEVEALESQSGTYAASPDAAAPPVMAEESDAERPAGAKPAQRQERSRKEGPLPASATSVEDTPRLTEAQVRQAELLKAQGIADLIEEGRRLLEAGAHEAAKSKFEEALLGEPGNLSAQYYLAKTLAASGQPQQALRLYQQVINNLASPLYEDARWELANAYLQAGKSQAARSLLAEIASSGGPYAGRAKQALEQMQK